MMNILSYSVIVFRGHSFLGTSVNYVLLALLLLAIINTLWMKGRISFLEQKNGFLLNAFHQANNSLMLTERMHEELAVENLPPLVSTRVRRLAAQIGDIMNFNKSVLSLSQEKTDDDFKTDEYELYSYTTSIVNRHREYAENCQVKLNVCKDAGYKACNINETAFTAALQSLVKRSIDSTRADGSVNVIVSSRDNQWSMEISNCSFGKHYRKYFGLFLTFVKIYCDGNFRFIWHVVRSHGGKISGYEWGKSAHYKITVPLGGEHSPISAVENTDHARRTDDLPHIVLIMENKELSGYLKDTLSGIYRVSVYEHYKQITVPLSNDNTDIIIIDAEAEGHDLCSKIKKNKQTSDVTVLLLTPSHDAEDLKEFEKWRADRFLPRIVPIERLKAELLSILEERRQQFERVIRLVNTDFSTSFPQDLMLSEEDAEIMRKINEFLKEHLAEKCEKEMLAGEMGMCKSKLFYTIKRITKVNIIRYIRSFKMERAKEELLTRKYQVAEVAIKVGYGDAKYFGKEFKKYCGFSPTEFMEKEGK